MNKPETHTRYRVQRLIRMGEWLEQNRALLIALYDSIDDAHTESLDMQLEDTLILEQLQGKQLAPLEGLGNVLMALRGNPDWGVKRGTDVTLYHPHACSKHKYEVVIPAPKPNTEETK